ncbi:hypothetical protein SNARM312S_06841 [Streptomyces narbonensis]
MAEAILEVRDLHKHYPLTQGILFKKQVGAVKVVDGVDFDLAAGETLGIVGESGCGKSTVAKMLVNLERPTSDRSATRATTSPSCPRAPSRPSAATSRWSSRTRTPRSTRA